MEKDQYPENQIYCIVPIKNVLARVGNVLEVCRKSIDGNFMIWKYHKQAEYLTSLKRDSTIKLYSHAEILKIMATPKWSAKDLLIYATT
jgi:hypothetical protein